MIRALLTAVLLLLAAVPTRAEEVRYNQVDFTTEASHRIDNDLLLAQMSIEATDVSPAKVARTLNTTVNDALKQAEAFPEVKAASGNQTTFPVYGKNNRLDAWRGKAELRLESRDFKAAGELIGRLQGSMQLAGVSFAVAPETRRKIMDELVTEGLAAFRKRADGVRTALGGTGYRIVHLNITSGGYRPQPLRMERAVMPMSAVSAPDFAGGESEITVQVSGTIEVTYPQGTARESEQSW